MGGGLRGVFMIKWWRFSGCRRGRGGVVSITKILPIQYRFLAPVDGITLLTDEEKDRFKKYISLVDLAYQGIFLSARWSDRLFMGEAVSLYVLDRAVIALRWAIEGYQDSPGRDVLEDSVLEGLKKIQPSVVTARNNAERMIREIKAYDVIMNEQDFMSRQMGLAKLMAITAVASAISSIFSAFRF